MAEYPQADFVDIALENARKNKGLWREMGNAAGEKIRMLFPDHPVNLFADTLIKLL